MFPTLARLSKASRKSLTPKQGNKDFYKGPILIYKTSWNNTLIVVAR